jgi:hypothetical protein
VLKGADSTVLYSTEMVFVLMKLTV